MAKTIKIPAPFDPIGREIFKLISDGKEELELPVPDLPSLFPLPVHEKKEAKEGRPIKIPAPFDPIGKELFKIVSGGKEELELPAPGFPFSLPFPGEEKEEADEGSPEREAGSEEMQLLDLLESTQRNLERGNSERALALLEHGIKLSRCSRCIRNMKSIEQKINSGDLSEAKRRLTLLTQLIPTYYEVIQGEGELGVELDSTKKIEEECDGCVASEIIELCQWNNACLDEIIAFIETQKAKGLKVMNEDVIRKAREFRRV